MSYHKSVLTREVLEYIAPKDGELYVDCTFGGGGHTRALLEAANCKVIAFDFDIKALEINGPALQEEFKDRLTLVWGNFTSLALQLKKRKITKVNGILADFGTSQYQIMERPGFSFSQQTALDMRMAPGHYKTTASDIVNQATEKELAEIFYTYGEEQKSFKVARALVNYRKEHGSIKTTQQLVDIVHTVIPPYSRPVHSATKVFQALRIFVNNELKNITGLLNQAENILAKDGRLVCISFHSLEDRIVKSFLLNNKHTFEILTPKVVVGKEDEVAENPSARSAKLRAAKKL